MFYKENYKYLLIVFFTLNLTNIKKIPDFLNQALKISKIGEIKLVSKIKIGISLSLSYNFYFFTLEIKVTRDFKSIANKRISSINT